MADIYFDERYGHLFEKIEAGHFEVFEFQHEFGSIRHSFIKREIPVPLSGRQYYDLVTPYGYGGPQILRCTEGKKADLVRAFEKAFQRYCTDNDVVSEFVRFHPVLENAQDFLACYDAVYLRDTVGTNLEDGEASIDLEFSKSTRKNIRQALKSGVEYRTVLNPQDLSAFKRIYYATMERNHADAFYYFGDEYFEDLMALLGGHVLLVEVLYGGQVIGAGLNFIYGKLAHTHLSGTLAEFNHLSAASVLNYALALWGIEHGVALIHGGGGRSNSPDDSLYLFKKQFGRQTAFKFYTGRKIWNETVYHELCERLEAGGESEFFPAYRSEPVRPQELNRV